MIFILFFSVVYAVEYNINDYHLNSLTRPEFAAFLSLTDNSVNVKRLFSSNLYTLNDSVNIIYFNFKKPVTNGPDAGVCDPSDCTVASYFLDDMDTCACYGEINNNLTSVDINGKGVNFTCLYYSKC